MKHPFQQLFKDLSEKISQQNKAESHLEDTLQAAGTLSTKEAVEVYQRAYNARLTEALGEKYERVWRYLGDTDFFKIALEFIDEHPSQVFELGQYGEEFPDFLHKKVTSDNLFLVDLAKLDALYLKVFHMPNPTHNSSQLIFQHADKLESIPLTLPSSAVFKSAFPIFDIWTQVKQRESKDSLKEPSPQSVLIYKSASQLYLKNISHEFYMFYKLLEKHGTLEGVVDEIELDYPEVGLELDETLQHFVKLNLLGYTA